MIEQMPISPDPTAKLAMITSTSWGTGTANCSLLTKSSVKLSVNERDGDRVIGLRAHVTNFVAIKSIRPQMAEEFGLMEVVVADEGDHGHYMQTEQVEGEVR